MNLRNYLKISVCHFEHDNVFIGAYVMRGRWLAPLGEALCDNPDLQLVIPMRARRAPPQPPPSNSLCALLLDMLDSDPDARPNADQLKKRVHSAILLHWPQSSILTDITMRPIKLMEQWWYLTLFILSKLKIFLFNVLHFVRYICYYIVVNELYNFVIEA